MKQVKTYPVVLFFFAFLLVFFALAFISPNEETAGRRLAPQPQLTAESIGKGVWSAEYTNYTEDHFVFNDAFARFSTLMDVGLGRLEINGVWLAKDGYQIAKNDVFTADDAKKLQQNVDAVAALAGRFSGKVDIMIVPSPENILQDKLPANPPQRNEDELLDNMFAQFTQAGGNVIDLRAILNENTDTQLFYRTDHHWTTTGGARLAYEAFCDAHGLAPVFPPQGSLTFVDGFLGTNYTKTHLPGTKPDTLEYYDLPNTITVHQPQADGSFAEEELPLMDTAKLEVPDKYAAFIQGNNGYSVINGNGTGSILVVKDSYGNSFIPYLIENYATIGIIDLRAWPYPVDDVFEEDKYDSILVLYSFDNFAIDVGAYRMAIAE